MPITPLPQFEADLAEHLKEKADREAYERLNVPTTLVLRFGVMKMVGEFPYRGTAKPGCGSKIVVRTHRGIEMGEMLTSTCPNSGCSKSVSRKEMLEYIQNSGGRDYPFHGDGMALRVATKEDMDRQAAIDAERQTLIRAARRIGEAENLRLRVVDAELLLGGERVTYYVTSRSGDDREPADVHGLQQLLRPLHQCRVEVRQVGARDEARLVADYERCGQYCCCKNFLKVLKPISMRSAKVQKATLDPLKISGRCGRLMCCLRYEDETYEELRKRLPNRKTRVGTPEGDGVVVDSQILTQLVLVRLDAENRDVAVPVEELTEPGLARPAPVPPAEPPSRPARERRPARDRAPADRAPTADRPPRRERPGPREDRAPKPRDTSPPAPTNELDRIMSDLGLDAPSSTPPKKRKRRRDKPQPPQGEPPAQDTPAADEAPKKKRRRRRRPGSGPDSSSNQGPGPSPN